MSIMQGTTRRFIILSDSLGYYFAKITDDAWTNGYRQPNMLYATGSVNAWQFRPAATNTNISNCPQRQSTGTANKTYIEVLSSSSTPTIGICPRRVFGGQSDTNLETFSGRTGCDSYVVEPTNNTSAPYIVFPSTSAYHQKNYTKASPYVECYYLMWWVPGTVTLNGGYGYEIYTNNNTNPDKNNQQFQTEYDGVVRDTGKTSGNYHLYVVHLMTNSEPNVGAANPVGIRSTVPLVELKLSSSSAVVAFAGWTYEAWRTTAWWNVYDPDNAS